MMRLGSLFAGMSKMLVLYVFCSLEFFFFFGFGLGTASGVAQG